MNNDTNSVQHNRLIMNIFHNIINAETIKGYIGTSIVLLSALGNFQIFLTVAGGIMGLGISSIALVKSWREAQKAKHEEEASRLNLEKIKNFLKNGSKDKKT